jgi:hypothetical protein
MSIDSYMHTLILYSPGEKKEIQQNDIKKELINE